ncbi:MAG: hypothetical protein KBH99_07965 [Syntrophobacteraceae bacterium]|nr:hypothetical protein [Syntrophobacteraceae bacterium]
MLYTPTTIVIAQAVIASPVVAGFSPATLQSVNPELRLQILSPGANRLRYFLLLSFLITAALSYLQLE